MSTDPWVVAAQANTDAIRDEVAAGRLDPGLAQALVIADVLGAAMDPACPPESRATLTATACALARTFRAERFSAVLLRRDPVPDDLEGLE